MALIKLQNKESTDTEILSDPQQLFSDFVLCQNFGFRVGDVDCFLHAEQAEGPAVTAVYLKGYSPHIEDPEKKLFSFICSQLTPKPITDPHE